jgi:N6-adenosine-specific RNA methylase IME4
VIAPALNTAFRPREVNQNVATKINLRNIMQVEFHPVADIFPLIEGEEFNELVADIAKNGLIEPIWLDKNGQIIDGRNRYLACKKAGVKPVFRTWEGEGSPIDFIISMNLKRRHLTTGQRAILAVEAESLFETEAIERKRATQAKPGTGKVGSVVAKLPLPADKGRSRDKAAKLFSISPRTVTDAKKLKGTHPTLFEEVRRGKKNLSEAKIAIRNQHKQAVAEQIRREPQPLPEGPFRVIAVDPPWTYVEGGNSLPYPTMSLDQIKALPVGKLAHDDCVLWLWTTVAHQRVAYEVLDAWGFEHKNTMTWVKDQIGTGDWLRGQTEHCFVAARGKPIFDAPSQGNAISGKRREHSRKPDEFYELVEATCPGSRVELFSREPREGWSAWGAEPTRFTGDQPMTLPRAA